MARVITLGTDDILTLMVSLSEADLHHRTVRVAIDADGFKYAVGGDVWTVGMGEVS